MNQTPLLNVKNLYKSYFNKNILNNLSFQVNHGEIFCVLGPSGCGKSTLLQVLSGLVEGQGEIRLQNEVLQDDNRFLTTEKRQIGIVFQNYSLFPHMSVEKNIAFGLPSQKNAHHEISKLLELIKLSGYQKKYPHELSGGEQQRVAIARALAHSPKLLLFDEPFSNLDVALRKRLRFDLKRILKENNITAIFITHDQEEAFDMGDRIAILNQGKFEQIGTGSDLYNFPQSLFVSHFMGSGNFVSAKLIEQGESSLTFKTIFDEYVIPVPQNFIHDQESYWMYLPSSAIELCSQEVEGSISFDVIESSFRGDFFNFNLAKDNEVINNIKSKKVPNSLGRLFLRVDSHYMKTFFKSQKL